MTLPWYHTTTQLIPSRNATPINGKTHPFNTSQPHLRFWASIAVFNLALDSNAARIALSCGSNAFFTLVSISLACCFELSSKVLASSKILLIQGPF
jgi:hypothetical protein